MTLIVNRHRMTPLMYACQFGHIDLARTLLSFDAGVNKQDSQGWTVSIYHLLLLYLYCTSHYVMLLVKGTYHLSIF